MYMDSFLHTCNTHTHTEIHVYIFSTFHIYIYMYTSLYNNNKLFDSIFSNIYFNILLICPKTQERVYSK